MLARRRIVIALGLSALTRAQFTFAQQQKSHRIGYLANDPQRGSPTFAALVGGLEELGWIEGRNIEIRFRASGGRDEEFAPAVADLIREEVDVIVTTGSGSTRAAMAGTKTIPIVFASAANPVEQQFVASLSRPGGNVTGLALLLQEVGARRLQLLKEILPRAKTFARLYSSVSIVDMQPSLIRENDQAARKLDVTVEHMAVAKPEEIDAIFERAAARRVEALIVEPEAVFAPNRARMAALALRHRLPMMCADARYAEAGALISYGENFPSRYRRAARLVDKILRGAKPGDIPVEQASQFELVINLKTAAALKLSIPQSTLLQADRLIN